MRRVAAALTLSGYLLMLVRGPLTLNLPRQTTSVDGSLASQERPLLDAPATCTPLKPFCPLTFDTSISHQSVFALDVNVGRTRPAFGAVFP